MLFGLFKGWIKQPNAEKLEELIFTTEKVGFKKTNYYLMHWIGICKLTQKWYDNTNIYRFLKSLYGISMLNAIYST